jgi:hypothetical protein
MTKFALLVVAFAIVLVNLLLKKGERIRGLALLVAWLVPGAGHVVLGRWKKGLFFFSVLAATYLFGLWIVGFRAISWEDNPFYFVGQWGSGATTYLAHLMSVQKAYPRGDLHPSWFDPGLLYVCAVGLLNIVISLNVLEVKRPAAQAPPASPEGKPAPAPPAAVVPPVAPPAAPGGTL